MLKQALLSVGAQMPNSNRKLDQSPGRKTANVTILETQNLNAPTFSDGDLGKIQEILFGQQMRDNTTQLASLNEHIQIKLEQLSQDCQRQFSELHTKLDESIESVKTTQTDIDKNHQVGISALTQQQTSLEALILAKHNENSDTSRKVQQHLKNEIETSNKALSDSLDLTRNELTKKLENAISELRTQKMDREALSHLLGVLATELSEGTTCTNGIQSALDPDKTLD